MRAECEPHLIPSKHQDIGVMIHAFGDEGNGVDQTNGGSEVGRGFLTN